MQFEEKAFTIDGEFYIGLKTYLSSAELHVVYVIQVKLSKLSSELEGTIERRNNSTPHA